MSHLYLQGRGVNKFNISKVFIVQKVWLYYKSINNKEDLYIVDEAIFHTLYTAFYGVQYNKTSTLALACAIKIFYRRIDGVICVSANRAKCVERFTTRNEKPGSRFAPTSSASFIRQFLTDRTYTLIFHALRR